MNFISPGTTPNSLVPPFTLQQKETVDSSDALIIYDVTTNNETSYYPKIITVQQLSEVFGGGAVTSVNGFVGAVVLGKTDVGLGNVTNDAQIPLSYLSTDGTLSDNSDTNVPTEKAVKTYVDQIITANDAMVYKGAIDCSTNPNYPAADAGHTYRIAVAGKIGGASGINVEAYDIIICVVDGTSAGNQATVGANWNILQVNLDGAVIGPTSSTNNGIPLYDGTTGKLLKNSGVLLPTGALVGTTDTQTLTNKTMDGLQNTIYNIDYANLINIPSLSASIGGGISGALKGSVLFSNPDATFAQNNQNFFYSDSLNSLLVNGSLGSELITNGTFTGNATGWTLPTGWAYSSNTIVHNANGTGAATPTTAVVVYAGLDYCYSITISSLTAGTLTLAIGGVTLETISANGTYMGKFIPTATTNLTLTPSNTARFTVDDVSLKMLSGGAVGTGSVYSSYNQVTNNSITTTTSPGSVLDNPVSATSGNPKASPSYLLRGRGFSGSSFPFDTQSYVIGKSGNLYGKWINEFRVNNGTWTEFLSYDTDMGAGEGFAITAPAALSNGNPGTTRNITIKNIGSYSWIDWKFSGTRKASDGANSSGGRDFYASGGNYFGYYNGNTNSLFSYNYPTAFAHYNDGYFGGRIHAGNMSYSSSTLKSAGSVALGKGLRVTSNYTLTANESTIYADASSAACSGTPTYACSHWTNQTDCEKWDAHGGCSWYAGTSCSVYNGDQYNCEAQSGCTYETADCAGIGAYDQPSCEAYSGCSWSNNPGDCSSFDEATCGSTSGCYMNYDYCYNYSDGGGDGTACGTVSGHGCSYDSGSGSCSDGMGDSGWFSSCGGTYDSYSCTGSYYTGNCTGTFGSACTGTASCSGIDDSTNCGFETGCTWSTAITLNLPQLITCPDRDYWIYNASSTNADVIIQPYSGDNIDHGTSLTLSNYKDAVHIKAYYELTSCGPLSEGPCGSTPGCSVQYSNCSWDSMNNVCSGSAVCDSITDQMTCEGTTYYSYCSGSYYVVRNWYLLSRS